MKEVCTDSLYCADHRILFKMYVTDRKRMNVVAQCFGNNAVLIVNVNVPDTLHLSVFDSHNVTELLDETGDSLREKGAEYGATTGRPRRCGWLDLPVVRQAVRINGLTEMAITKIDILTGYEKLPVCVGYRINGKEYDTIPASLRDYAAAEPVYRYFDGWTEDISRIREFDKLPENCRKYVRFIEKYCGCSVSLVSVGPDREENIILRKII